MTPDIIKLDTSVIAAITELPCRVLH